VLLAITHLTVVLTRATARPAIALEGPPAVEPITAQPQSETASLDPPPTAAGVTAADADGGADRRALAAELREQDWSNKAIARHLGVHPSTVGRWLPRAHQSDEADPSGSQPEMEGVLP
jgi:transcriptional regulator with GAF, ATPase, and Fis domain